MTVYIDSYNAKYGRLVMCHMIADTDQELRDMAVKIGVQQKWHQGNHFDICLSKKALAIQYGALEITAKQCAAMIKRQSVTGDLGRPDDSLEWLRDYFKSKTWLKNKMSRIDLIN